MADRARVEAFGDAALLVTFGAAIDATLTARARAAADALGSARRQHAALGRPVPALASVLVPFDPLAIDLDDVIAVVTRVIGNVAAGGPADAAADEATAPLEIPVRYGGADGPDLEAVAERAGLRPADVAEIHAGATYRVLFLGFAPGFGYLGGLPPTLATPRRPSPRERVPAGSVAIAGEQTAIYPRSMPGGWQLIGRTDTVLFDPRRDPPALLRPGAAVRFVPARPR
jgi:KipI family sensor histidine kinase inhibitor